MNNCENDILHIVRGDDVFLAVTIVQPNGREYEMQEGDKIEFCMKKNPQDRDEDAAFQDVFTNEVIKIDQNITAGLEPGRYVYDVKLVQEDTDNNTTIVTTLIPLSNALVHETTHVSRISEEAEENG